MQVFTLPNSVPGPKHRGMSGSKTASRLIQAAAQLRDAVNRLHFGAPVTHVYNPLQYAWNAHESYLSQHGHGPKRVLFLGMNPGPFGMAQTGVPFGEITAVRDWIGVNEPVQKPVIENPARPIEGFACARSEVSGRRLWGLFAQRFDRATDFFADHFVVNYCPLVFMEESGRNRTPDKLPAEEAEELFAHCDAHLRAVVDLLAPRHLIGVGGFAEKCFRRIYGRTDPRIDTILHPSPASPAANRGWAEAAEKKLISIGVWKQS
jgi:single-strand selective monofunctional uracil DNA glycosylase